MDDTELRSSILEDMERLREDVAEFLKYNRRTRNSGHISGVICPGCGYRDNNVTDSRCENGFKLRRRTCQKCSRKWKTIEVMVF